MPKKTEKVERPPLPPHKYEVPCIETKSYSHKTIPGKTPVYDALPRDCEFAFMTPGYYATGFNILDVYKQEVDFSEMRSLIFLEDPKKADKWGFLKTRIPFPETRVTDLPGTRDLNYYNYCLRSLTPKSAMSWRKSIAKDLSQSQHPLPSQDEKPQMEDVKPDDSNNENNENIENIEK